MKPPVQHHQFVGDGRPDHRGEDRCTECLTPRSNARHQLPAVPAGVSQAEARKLGENGNP